MQAQIANGFTLLQNANGDYYSCLGTMEQVHPMVAIRMNDKKNTGNSLMGTLYANFTPIKDLVFTTRLDSPLAVEATTIFGKNVQDCFDDTALALVQQGINQIGFPGLRMAITSDESKMINFNDKPKVILSASGMCEAGQT